MNEEKFECNCGEPGFVELPADAANRYPCFDCFEKINANRKVWEEKPYWVKVGMEFDAKIETEQKKQESEERIEKVKQL